MPGFTNTSKRLDNALKNSKCADIDEDDDYSSVLFVFLIKNS